MARKYRWLPLPKFKKRKINKAPIVQFDSQELGDKRLNPEETVYREREELLKQVSNRKIWGQEELEDVERSGGPRMQPNEFLRRLRKANTEIHVRDGSLGSVALYIPKHRGEYDPETFDPDRKGFYHDHKYVGGFLLEPIPEFSHVTTDSSQIAHREVRSWRSVLLALIKGGALTYTQAVKEFGEPLGSRAGRWQEQMQKYKPR